jgi:hypothetical protein
MLRVILFVVGVCLCTSTVVRADESAAYSPSLTVEEKDALFAARLAKAERANSEGRLDDAATGYRAALDVYADPIVKGRLGLVLAKLGQVDKAAQELHDAVTRGQGAAAKERQAVLAAYDKARAATTWVNVKISQLGANVTYDGSPRNPLKFSSFWMFALPGEHTFRATLDGHAEAVETFTAKPGEEITITLNLAPIAPKLLEKLPTDEEVLRKKRKHPPHLVESNVAGDPNYSAKEDPFYGEPKPQKAQKQKPDPLFSLSGGVVAVFGVASWNPAIGAVVGVGLRPKEFFSLGLEGRAAWLTTPVAGRESISAMTAGGLLRACGHVKWFFGCGLGYVGTVYVYWSGETYIEDSRSFVQPGGGARIGAEFPIGSSFVTRAGVDLLRLPRRVVIGVGNRIIVDQAPFMVGAQVSGEWRF